MAFPRDLKVVKVGDIDAPPEEQSYLWPETCASESTETALDQLSWKFTNQVPVCSGGWSIYHNDELVKPVSEELELPDGGGVPENWPQIPQLSRRRSCEASGERTNCVNKAVEHLQLLQDIFAAWVKKTEEEKITEDTDADRKLSICDFSPENNKDALVPLSTDLASTMSAEALKDYNSDDQLKVVVKEVMVLLAWLHDDCQQTEAKLQSEKNLVSQLSLKIDNMSQKKLNDLRAAVQKEHDLFKEKNRPCLVHLTYLNRIHATCESKLKSIQNLNFHLKKDIALRNEQIPLVQDKMLLENQHIDKMQNALNEAEQMMNETLKNKADADARYEEAQEIIRQEQNLLDQQLNAACGEYNKLFNAAEEAEKNYYIMSQGIVDGKKHIQDNEKEKMMLAVKLENSKTQFNSLQLKNVEEKEHLVVQLKETKDIRSENKKLQLKIKDLTSEFNAKLLEIDQEKLRLEKEFHLLAGINQALSSKIESIQFKIEESKKQKEFYEKNLKRMTHDIVKIENQIMLTRDELERMNKVNTTLNNIVDKAHMKTVAKEKSLKQTIDQIRKEIDSENKIYLDMTTQIQDLEFELRNIKTEGKEEKEKLLTILSNATNAQKKLTDKIHKLTDLKQQKIEALAKLEEKKLSMKEKFDKIIKDNAEYLAHLRPYQRLSQNKSKELEMKIYAMTNDEERMKMEIEVMFQQGKALESSQNKIEENIVKLNDILKELNLQLETFSKSSMDTRTRLEQAADRLSQEHKDHNDLMCCRKEVLEDILQKKMESLEENEQLASKYRTNQTTLGEKKKEYIRLSEETVLLKQALKDLKQLLKMQIKMQYNTTNYYHYRGLYHSQQLTYFVNASTGSQNKIKQLRFEINSKMETMVTHLNEISFVIYQHKSKFLPKIGIPTS